MFLDTRRAAFAALLVTPSLAAAQDDHVVGVQAPPPPPLRARSVGAASAAALLSNVAGAATASVPGLGGVQFQPGATTAHFDRVYAHPAGHWVLTALADLPSDRDECLIASGALLAQEGSAAAWVPGGGENCGTIDQRCAVNAHGDVAFATNSSGSVDDDWIVTWRGGVWGHAAREGDAVPGLAGATLDDAIDSCVLLDDGRAGFAADGVDGVANTSVDDLLVLGSAVLMQEGVTMPTGQPAGTGTAIENFDLGDFWSSADGSSWIVQGDLVGGTTRDDVAIVDGHVVLQEGQVVPGSGFAAPVASGGVGGVSMDADGVWFALGDNTGGHDWVLRDGVIVAETGAPIAPGTAEVWDDTGYADGFIGAAGNGYGSYVIAGVTDHPDNALDAVMVLDGERVIARESDPVDLDGNGAFDDGVFIDTFGDDDLALTASLEVLCVATLKDASGQRVGQALLSIDARGGLGEPYCSGTMHSAGGPAQLAATGSLDAAGNDLALVLTQGPADAHGVILVGRIRGDVPGFNGSSGVLCLAGVIGVRRGPGQIIQLDVAGAARFPLDLTALPLGTSLVAAQAGETWQFQAWFRDLESGSTPTSNTSSGVEVVLR